MKKYILAAIVVALAVAGSAAATSTANVLRIGGIECHKDTAANGGSIACFKSTRDGYIVGINKGMIIVEKQDTERVVLKRYSITGPPDGVLPLNDNRMYSPAGRVFCEKDIADAGVACIQADATGFGFGMSSSTVLVYNNDTSKVVWRHTQ
jgi:hypothetical protein